MSWRITETGLDETERKVRQLEVLLRDFRPFWPKLVPLFIGWVGRQFASSGGFFGTPWAPLTPAYAAAKAARHGGKGLLVAEGDLKRAALTPGREASATSLTLFLQGWKGDPDWHQSGTTKMPARPVYPEGTLPLTAVAEVTRAAEEYADELLARVGL